MSLRALGGASSSRSRSKAFDFNLLKLTASLATRVQKRCFFPDETASHPCIQGSLPTYINWVVQLFNLDTEGALTRRVAATSEGEWQTVGNMKKVKIHDLQGPQVKSYTSIHLHLAQL